MISKIKKFLSVLIIAFFAISISNSAFCATSNFQQTATDIGDYGSWATENNRTLLLGNMTDDLDMFFSHTDTDPSTFVPLEAKLGLSFMNAFSYISHVLNHSLTRFIIIFIIAMFGYWLTLEAITIINATSKPEDKIKEIIQKFILVIIWVTALSIGPAKMFEFVISPILYIATIASDVILNGAANFINAEIPNTCGAIQNYVKEHIADTNILHASTATNMLCVPTRMSTFAYTAISTGWGWIKYGIGNDGFILVCGLGMVGFFIYMLWQFAFIAFGVIADLFLAIIMLPFTAVNETIGKTSYKGIVGNIFNGFLKLFSSESLSAQFQRFIDAALHFVVLSVIITICMALMSMAAETGVLNDIPDIEDMNFWVTLLLAGTAGYLAKNASKFADDLGGKINTEYGDKFKNEIYAGTNAFTKSAKGWWKAFRKK
ncbi:MAG: hypothetical protein J6R99_02620 [Alphaproteobacteria bacterium]|nr:hypothetical protein [Alphaproteobacteria bacterium]